MKISIAPIPYFWEKDRVLAFYEQLQDAPVDIVYLGETVCSKRRELGLTDWLAIAEQLTVAGKQHIDIIRIAPQAEITTEITTIIKHALDGGLSQDMATKQLEQYQSNNCCDGYWNDQAGMSYHQNL